MKAFTMLLAAVVIMSCDESSFTGAGGASRSSDSSGRPSQDTVDSKSHVITVDEDQVSESFLYKDGSGLVDIVFVIDNSPSMQKIRNKVESGFNSLIGSGAFPSRTRIAVMNTMVADYNNLNKHHYSNGKTDAEPGFLRFVKKSTIEAYLATSFGQNNKSEFTKEGCVDGWFKPEDRNASGDYCLSAHTQMSFEGGASEAGTQAFAQFLDKHQGQSIFRTGAVVNVVFVSDTHDAGDIFLASTRKTYQDLRSRVDKSVEHAGFRVHAFAPDKSSCGEELYQRWYFNLVNESGGFKADSCEVTDYRPAVQSMLAAASIPTEPIYTVTYPIRELIKVEVDGAPITDYELIGDQSLKISGLSLEKTVTVYYRK